MKDILLDALRDIARPALSAETIFSPFPSNRLGERQLCPVCRDAMTEGEACAECVKEQP